MYRARLLAKIGNCQCVLLVRVEVGPSICYGSLRKRFTPRASLSMNSSPGVLVYWSARFPIVHVLLIINRFPMSLCQPPDSVPGSCKLFTVLKPHQSIN